MKLEQIMHTQGVGNMHKRYVCNYYHSVHITKRVLQYREEFKITW